MMESLLSIAPGLDVTTLLLIATMAFAGGVVGGLSGMGAALVLSPFIAPVVGVRAVVPVLSVAMLFSQAGRIWVYRDTLNLRIAGNFLLGAVPGAIIGTSIYAMIPENAIATLLGVFLILAVPLRRMLERRSFQLRGLGRTIGSLGFGTLAGSTVGVGVVMLPLLMGSGLTGPGLIATKAVVSISVHVTKITMFSSYDLLPGDLILMGCCIGVFTLPGVYVARWLLQRIPVALHTTAIDILVFLGGISFLWHAIKPTAG